MVHRRTVLRTLLAAATIAFTAAHAAEAQARKAPRIGVLLSGAAPRPGQPSRLVDAFRGGLADLGYVEGENLVIEYRWGEGRDDRLADLAADLVRLNVAVIVTAGTPAARAAKAATGRIPVVMAAVGDPIGAGLVASLARPGANVTGLSLLDTELAGKRLELLKETVPTLMRLAILWSANDPGMTLAFDRVATAAQSLGLALQSLAVREAVEFPEAFEAARAGRADALLVTAQPFTLRHQAQIVDLAARQRLPTMYTVGSFVEAGGLMAYGASVADLYRRAATYVDKILKGARPADLPIEQPTKFELVINGRTAKALGLLIPPALMLRADRVIE